VAERDARLTRAKEYKRAKFAMETVDECEEQPRRAHSSYNNTVQDDEISEGLNPQAERNYRAYESGVDKAGGQVLSQAEEELLSEFRERMDKIKHTYCPTCKENFPSIVLVKRECRRCNKEKPVKRFSAENNMDPGEVPIELQDLTEIEEMLIARVFPVMSVYRLRGGQHGYRGNVINFPQDVQEFATKLPRHPSSLEVLIIRRQSMNSSEGFRDFRVRRLKVARALVWLRENNRFYAEVIIDHEVIKSLPSDGSIGNQLRDIGGEEEDENDDDVITRSFVPYLPPACREDDAIRMTFERMQEGLSVTTWPRINPSPINEFHTPGYIACAFPTLYPTGQADLRSERISNVKPAEYFKHLLMYHDGRFAQHGRWRYFALNSQMRWRALQEGKIYVKQHLEDGQITVTDIQERINQGDNRLADRIMRYGEGLRGSRQFWNARRNELSDMIKQIGSQGLVFFTFSAADFHWPELHKIMPPSNEYQRNSSQEFHQNIIDNPHIAAWFFSKRFEIFFNDVLKPQWDLEDWWFRYEWQHRGSAHVHGIGKRRNVPVIDWEKIHESEGMMREAIEYFDDIVSTINPGLGMPIPEHHPCRKKKHEIQDDMQDYIELINKLQRHTRCSTLYCIRKRKDGQQECRFGYPKEVTESTYIKYNDHREPELITKRNDPLVNPHSRLQLQGWRANVDLKPILTIHAALQYISKYASKAEPRSETFSEILNRILNESQEDDPIATPVQRLLLHSVAERDISAQETCHILLGLPLYHSSRKFVFLNLNEESSRWIRGTGENEETAVMINDKGRTEKSPLRVYWERPSELESFSLYRLNLTHRIVKHQWVQCQKENILRIFPRPSPIRKGMQWEEFCRIKVILHVQHRDLQQLTVNGSISWSTLYADHIEEINADPNDLLGPPIDEDREMTDEEEEQLSDDDDEQDEFRSDWMVLAGMGPKANIDSYSDLGLRDVDVNHDWINDPKQRYTETDFASIEEFIIRDSGVDAEKDTAMDYQSLNDNQKRVFNRIESHYNDVLAGNQVDPLRIIVMGTAGTGKTYLIKAIRKRLREMTGTGIRSSPMIVLAPTGVAAFNINGSTIHSRLSIPIINGSKNFDINGERLKKLQERFKDVKYVLIDEKSMVGRQMLGLIDVRLRQAFPEHNNEPFGGRSVIMFGDFGQLPPVRDLPMYVRSERNEISNNGHVVYRQFREAYKLEIVQRQAGSSEQQQQFRNILLRLRDGESTIDDWKILTTRIEDKISTVERNSFSEALFISTKWVEVNAINIERLRALDVPVARINAIHTGGKEAKQAESDVACGLEARVLLARGARVMLTVNLQTETGLVNGTIGTVRDIIFKDDDGPPSLPIAVMVAFDNYNGPTITNLEGEKVVPIVPVQRTWMSKSGTSCSRTQIPVRLAWAITVHKSQGLTLRKVIIDLGDKEFSAGLSFVAVSRVHALEDIIFRPFNFERLQHLKNGKRLQERLKEETRLTSMIPGN
jgi:hypothetical protein